MFRLKMPRKLSKGTVVLFILGAAITGYTSLKTIDLLKFTMPPDQEAFAWFGWACFEIGLAAWIYWHGAGSRRDQRTISGIMIVVDLISVVVAFVADTILTQARRGGVSIDQSVLTWAIIIAVCVIATANLCAVVATKLYDPETQKRIRQEEYQEALEEAQEQAEHAIELERLKYIQKNAAAIAPQIGYQQGMDWTQQQYQRYALPGMTSQQPPALPPVPQPAQFAQQASMPVVPVSPPLTDARQLPRISVDPATGHHFMVALDGASYPLAEAPNPNQNGHQNGATK